MTIAVEEIIEASQISLAIAQPDFSGVDDQLDTIQTELMKKGTVAFTEIDWDATFDLSVGVLREGAHIDALTAAALAVIQAGSDNDLVGLLKHLKVIFAESWDAIQPSAPKFARLKKTRTQDIVNAIPRRHSKEPIFAEGFQDALGDFIVQAKVLGLDIDDVSAIYIPPSEDTGVNEISNDTAARAQQQQSATTAAPSNPYQADLDAKGRAQLKRDVASLAARIEAFRVSDPTPFYLRAFSATLELRTAPESDADGITAMNAMPTEIADPFEKAAENPSYQTLQQIEQRLLSSPDWFEGQALALRMAQILGQNEVANAIRHRVQNRLQRLPKLADLRYSNGKPYLPDDVTGELVGSTASNERVEAPLAAEDSLAGELDKLVESEGLTAALNRIEAEANSVDSERESALLILMRAELLMKAGLGKLAEDSIRGLVEKFYNEELQNWDSQVYQKLKKIRATVEKSKRA